MQGAETKPQAEKAGFDGIVSLLSAIVDSSDDAIVSKTLDGIIISWNPAAEKMFGYTAAEAIGQSIRLIIPAELQAEEDYVLSTIRRGEKVDHFETVRQRKDGRRIDISLTVSPIRNALGDIVGASKIARDITDRKRQEALLSAIIQSSDDAIISKTLDGVVTSWNPAAERMFGFTAAEAIGQSIRMIIPPERQAEEDYILNQIRSGEKVDHLETIYQTRDGRRLNVSLSVSPVKDAHGLIVGASKIVRDVTLQKKTERDRDTAIEELAKAVAERDEFIATAAHELRNPLNVLTLLWRLMDRTLGRSRTSIEGSLFEKSGAHVAHLSALVDRLLDISRIRSGTFDLYPETFDLSSLIQEVANRFIIGNSAISISLQLEPRIEGTWDRLRIDQVVANLVSNAVKYGSENPIAIGAFRNDDQAIITVRDQGIGISPEDMRSIFDRFVRATRRSKSESLGMGLWITKQIVEAHGGTVVAESELGKGSIFTVRIPLATQQGFTNGPPRR
jgi:PAS domain S-box-containing protein